MLHKINQMVLMVENRLELLLPAIAVVLCAVQIFFCSTSIAHAAIVWTGEVDPADPTTWTSSTYCDIGRSSTGTVSVDGGSKLASNQCYLGYQSGSTGTARVTGAGSKWTNGNELYVGYSGNGDINLDSGGQVVVGISYLGNNSGSTGTATVTGVGSKWTSNTSFTVGYYGNGTLNIEAGGQVSNSTGYLGYRAGSTGKATVTGAGSKWVNSSCLYVGYDGSGALTVTDGGMVTVNYGLFASLNGLYGNGTISTNGGVLDADLVFDAAHGLQNTISFGTGGTLNVIANAISDMGAGYKGNGTLRIAGGIVASSKRGYLGYWSGSTGIATVSGTGSKWTNSLYTFVGYYGSGALTIEAGGQVSNTDGYLGYYSGSNGTATVTGTGSKWINNGSLYVGYNGSGTLTVTDGGIITVNNGLFASLNNLFGNGVITTNGGLLDADLIFDATHGLQNAYAFGSGGTLNFNQNQSSILGVGYKGNGTLRIAEGIVVPSSIGYLGYTSGSTGTATVTGAGSKWTTSGSLYVGVSGSGILNIIAGGQVSSTGDSYLASSGASTGMATVTGAGSTWTTSSSLYVGYNGSGTLTVTDGGMVIINNGLFASLDNLFGDGTVSTHGGVFDIDLVFDSTHGLQKTFGFGSGGLINLNQDGAGALGSGYKGNGTLRITEGIAVSSSSGYLGFLTGSNGTATVTGNGSKWSNSGSLYIGYRGIGTLNIEAGGQVNNADCYLGYYTTGTVTVTDAGSQCTSRYLYVGNNGNGALRIQAGGQVNAQGSKISRYTASTSNATVTGAGSKWVNSSYLTVGDYGSGTLSIEAGGQVSNTDGYLGYEPGANGTATVIGVGSKWINSSSLNVGYYGSGTLNIGSGSSSGGLVTAKTLNLANVTFSNGICNVNGGTLQTGSITRGWGSVTFNWNDGTIQNYDTSSNLTISSNLSLKLASFGTHAFNIDLNRTGTINAVLSDATSGGSLDKIGAGTLLLTGANTYSGGTVVEEGRFKVTGSILNTSGISVGESGILELAKSSGSATAANMPISNAGTILISAGSQKVGAITGLGITQINTGATLTSTSIVQGSLIIGTSGMSGSTNLSQVPEPSTLTLLGAGVIGMVIYASRLRRRRGLGIAAESR